MLYYKVRTNKLKSKTFLDNANFNKFFQGEDEIELNDFAIRSNASTCKFLINV